MAAIGIGIGLLLGIWALVIADSGKARTTILGAMVVIFLLPVVWHGPAAQTVSLFAWIIYGAACFIYVKWRGEGGWFR
jgi:hypothetical protein